MESSMRVVFSLPVLFGSFSPDSPTPSRAEPMLTKSKRAGSKCEPRLLAPRIVRAVLRLALVGALLWFPLGPAGSHTLKELEQDLSTREKYFQPIEKLAPPFTLKDADGRIVQLSDYAGKVVVLHFIYAICPDVCPLHAELIAKVQQMVNGTPMQFLSIATDPVRDTPDVLRGFGLAHGLDPRNWAFLTSGPEEPDKTRALVEQFGHRFDVTPSGVQIHSVVTHVIDREGQWRANFHGLQFDPTNLVVFINALVNDVHQAEQREKSLWESIKELF
jgi:protein SCO1/2